MCQSHQSAKYRSRSPGQRTCRVNTSRRSTIQSLVVEGLIIEDIQMGDSFCVEVLRPSQPNGVMSSAVSLPNHTFTGQA